MKRSIITSASSGPKPRRGDLFIDLGPNRPSSFLFFGGAELYGALGTGTVPRFNGARTNRIRHAPPKNKKEDGRFGPWSINRSPLRGLGPELAEVIIDCFMP